MPENNGLPTDTQCTTDDDCVGLTPSCNTATNRCYPGCTTTADCTDQFGDTFECTEQSGGVMACAPATTAGDSCSSNADCDDGQKCVPPGSGVCFPTCSTDENCSDMGFDVPCKSQSFTLVTIKYCDLTASQPTTTDEDNQGEDSGANLLALWTACAAIVASWLFV
jgi:hypothetical protein